MNKFIIIIFLFLYANVSYSESITIQSTTSTRDSGLYKFLLPKYPKFNEIQIKLIAVGTGQAIMNAENCDGNILIVHDKKREDKFMNSGYGISRFNLMYNDFVIIGPKKDKANIKFSKSASEVFSKIYNQSHIFISRSDSICANALISLSTTLSPLANLLRKPFRFPILITVFLLSIAAASGFFNLLKAFSSPCKK